MTGRRKVRVDLVLQARVIASIAGGLDLAAHPSMRALWLVLLGCGGSTEPTAEPSSDEVFVEIAGETRFELGALVVTDGLLLDDTRAVLVAGGERAALDGSVVRVADDRFATAIASFEACGDDWLFVGSDGLVARSDDFVGPLEIVTTLPRASWEVRAHGELVSYLSETGSAFVGECRSAPRAIEPLGDVPVRAIAGTREVLLALVDGGRVYRSRDRGSSWERVDVEVASDVIVSGDAIAVRTFDGCSIASGDEWTHGECPVAAAERRFAGANGQSGTQRPSAASLDAITRRIAELHPSALMTMARRAAIEGAAPASTTDGRYIVRRGASLAFVGARGAIETHALPGSTLECEEIPWGRFAALVCPGGRVLRVGARADAEEISAPSRPAFSDDGLHLVHAGECSGGDRGALCLRDIETAEATTIRFPSGAIEGGEPPSLRLRGTAILATHRDAAWYGAPGATVLERVSGVAARAPAGGMPISLAADRAIFGFARLPDENGDESVLAAFAGEPSPSLEAFPLPRGARMVGFSDRSWGVAAGDTMAELWVTRDGGRSWRGVDAGVDGDASSIELDDCGPDCAPSLLRCDRGGCEVGSNVRVSRRAAASTRVVAARAPIADRASRSPVRTSLGTLMCTTEGGESWRDSEDVRLADPRLLETSFVSARAVSAGRAEVRVVARELAYEIEWTRGGRTRRSTIPASDAEPRTATREPRCVELASLESGVLLARCLFERSERAMWAIDGQEARPFPGDHGTRTDDDVAFAIDRGDHMLVSTGSHDAWLLRADRQARVSPIAHFEHGASDIGWLDGALVLWRVAGSQGNERRAYALDGGEPYGPLLDGPERVDRICSERSATPTAVWLRVERVTMNGAPRVGEARALVEIPAGDPRGPACVRRAIAPGLPPLEAEGGALAARSGDERIVCSTE